MSTNQLRTPDWLIWLAALAGPVVVTVVLLGYSNQIQRDYVFIYLGLVAVVGVLRGLWPALACATISFLPVDHHDQRFDSRLAGVDVHILRARDSDGARANQPSR